MGWREGLRTVWSTATQLGKAAGAQVMQAAQDYAPVVADNIKKHASVSGVRKLAVQALIDTAQAGKNLVLRTAEVIRAVPDAIKKLRQKPIRSAVKNVIAPNFKYSLLIFKPFFKKISRATLIWLGFSEASADITDVAIEIAVTKMWLRLFLVNTIATLHAARNINQVYSEEGFLQVHAGEPENKFAVRMKGTTSLLLHFILGNAVINGLIQGSRSVGGDATGWLMSLILGGYFKGVILYEYALDQQEVGSTVQMQLLTNEPVRCCAVGMLSQLLSQAARSAIASEPWLTAIDNIQTVLFILLAHENSFPIPKSIPPLKKGFTLDPVELTMRASIRIVDKLSTQIKPFIKAFFSPTDEVTIWQRLGRLLRTRPARLASKVFLPEEMRSLSVLLQHPNVLPYITACGIHDVIFEIARINQSSAVQATRFSVRYIPGAEKVVKAAGKTLAKWNDIPVSLVDIVSWLLKQHGFSGWLEQLARDLKEANLSRSSSFVEVQEAIAAAPPSEREEGEYVVVDTPPTPPTASRSASDSDIDFLSDLERSAAGVGKAAAQAATVSVSDTSEDDDTVVVSRQRPRAAFA